MKGCGVMKLQEICQKTKKTIQDIDLSQVNAGTVVRLIMVLISCILYVVKVCGIEIPLIDESVVSSIVIVVFGLISFLQAYWKNNSWTKAAQEADAIMQEKKSETLE